MFKKIGKAVGGTVKKVGGAAFDVGKSAVKGATKGVVAKLPGASMVGGLVGGLAKQVIPSGSSNSESAKKAGAIQNTQTVNVSKSKEKETGGEKKNIFKRFWDWMQEKKAEPKGAWIFWGILRFFVLLLHFLFSFVSSKQKKLIDISPLCIIHQSFLYISQKELNTSGSPSSNCRLSRTFSVS